MRMPRGRELCIVFRSGVLATLVPIMVKAFPLPHVLWMLEPKRKRRSSCDPLELARIAGAAVRLGPRLGVGECLLRSLVLYNLLRRSAYDPVLVIGGRLSEDRLQGHCWIEIDGKPIGEPSDPGHVARIFVHPGSEVCK
jgi:Transglutaminase-like superfamily